MQVRTKTVCLASLAAVVVSLSGCTTVSTKEYLNTACGPANAPGSYRIGGPRPETEVGSRVTLIRSAEVSSGWSGSTSAPAHAPAPAGAAPAPAASQPGAH